MPSSVRFNSHISLNVSPICELGFYPRLILLLPQVIMIGVILASYPYPQTTSSSSDPIFHTTDNIPSSVPPTEESIPWQSNIQGIQNLMGAT